MEQANKFLSSQDPEVIPFESDTRKIVKRHLEDPNHVITEEELKSIRVGMTPSLDSKTDDKEGDELNKKLSN